MKKVLAVVALVIVVGLAIFGKNYYDNTYVGSTYYAQVPANQSTEIEEWQGGSYTLKGHQYELLAYNEKGEKKTVKFDINDNGKDITSADLLQPGEYLEIEASTNRVIKWHRVTADQVPEKVRNLL